MAIQPYILGYGRAGRAIHEAILLLAAQEPDWDLRQVRLLQRDDPLAPARDSEFSILFVANPPGLHAQALVEGAEAGFHGLGCEKPVCIAPDEIAQLKNLGTKTAIFHVYRQMWGPQTLRQLIARGDLGQLISIEGRYWQPSTAERALTAPGDRPSSWKNDPALSGPFDTLLDTGSHWLDLAVFLASEQPAKLNVDLSYANAETPHRDSHAWITVNFPSGTRGFGSISKNVHGATNQFEIHVLGTRKAASWNFLEPDEILLGEGRDRAVITRRRAVTGTRHPPFHGAGWLEGYVEIIRQLVLDVRDQPHELYPDLSGALPLMESVLATIGDAR